MKSKRQLVESSLIASSPNCNLKPGDFPIDRLTATAIVKSLNLEPPKVKVSTPATSFNTVTTSNLPSVQQSVTSSPSRSTTGPQISPSLTSDTLPATASRSSKTTSNKASNIQSQNSAAPISSALPRVNTSDNSNHPTSSPRTSTSQTTSLNSSFILQSQARALPDLSSISGFPSCLSPIAPTTTHRLQLPPPLPMSPCAPPTSRWRDTKTDYTSTV